MMVEGVEGRLAWFNPRGGPVEQNMAVKLKGLPWFFWFIGIDLFFISLTILGPYTAEAVRNSILHHFDLGAENNLANWWSAMNFLLLALLAYELYSTRIDLHKTAWLVLAGIYAFLSLDELGSIHERLRDWSYLLVIAALFGLGYLFVLYRLLQDRETRSLAVWILLGSVLLASVASQEFLEHFVRWPSWAIGIRTGVEEGSELLGAFLILWQLIRYRLLKGLAVDATLKAAIPDPFRMRRLPVIMLAGLILHSLVSLVVVFRKDQSNLGNPSLWYIFAVFLVIFCASFWLVATYSEKGTRWFWGGVAILFLMDSLIIVYLILPRPAESRLYSLGFFASAYFIFAVQSLLVLVGLLASYGLRALQKIIALAGLAFALVLASRVQGLPLEFIMVGVYACVMAFICLTRMEKVSSLVSAVQK